MATEEEKGLRMTELARSFPALRFKFADAMENGLDPWDFARLAEASLVWSSGERLAVSFLGQVWNSDDAHEFVGHFNAVDSYKRWDRGNWQAFAGWAQKPFNC